MFNYEVCNVYDEEIFYKVCASLEHKISELRKEKMLTDVDGSQIQIYHLNEAELKVENDKDFGVNIEAGFDIETFFR